MKGDFIIAMLPEVLGMQFLKGKIPKILNTVKPERKFNKQSIEFLFWDINSLDHDQFLYAEWAELYNFLNGLDSDSPRFDILPSRFNRIITFDPNGAFASFGALGVSEDSSNVDEWGDPFDYEMYPEISLLCGAREVSNDSDDV